MSRGHSSSSCSYNSWGMQNPRLSNHGGGVLSHGGAPICNCGEVAVLRTARTTKNGGKQFWGCPNYKRGSEAFIGCNYFKWCSEDAVDERDNTIIRQRRKIFILEKELKGSRMFVNVLLGIVGLLVVLNIIVLSRLMKSV
ncbi:hypothetical protein DEO72_LG10g1732 [Vigna unguiculata]|uniref:GRF-type domain-containing protein n=1 Tax=Vigna unguiculata TaxID=3917 RepID=A0A4D6NC72_VIGUN|nr:hypothetical protein DEO72_LG10g1732 [Vigna unguiculata]